MQVDTQNKEFQDALKLIQYTRQSVFLTGKAGTRQVYLLKICMRNNKEETYCIGSHRHSSYQCRWKYPAQFL